MSGKFSQKNTSHFLLMFKISFCIDLKNQENVK